MPSAVARWATNSWRIRVSVADLAVADVFRQRGVPIAARLGFPGAIVDGLHREVELAAIVNGLGALGDLPGACPFGADTSLVLLIVATAASVGGVVVQRLVVAAGIDDQTLAVLLVQCRSVKIKRFIFSLLPRGVSATCPALPRTPGG